MESGSSRLDEIVDTPLAVEVRTRDRPRPSRHRNHAQRERLGEVSPIGPTRSRRDTRRWLCRALRGASCRRPLVSLAVPVWRTRPADGLELRRRRIDGMALDLAFCGTYTDPSPAGGVRGDAGQAGDGDDRPDRIGRHLCLPTRRETGALTPSARRSGRQSLVPRCATKAGAFCSRSTKFANSADRLRRGELFRDRRRCRRAASPEPGRERRGQPLSSFDVTQRTLPPVANHEAGSVAVLAVVADGRLSDVIDIHVDEPVDLPPAARPFHHSRPRRSPSSFLPIREPTA